ncbi:MAG: hypothetical protein CFE44_28245, partial [Burkholderiales bacterium PBB4]
MGGPKLTLGKQAMVMTNKTKRTILSIGAGVAMCFVVAWQQSIIANFSPTSGKTARGFITEYLDLAYATGQGADARAAYFASDATDHASNPVDQTNGPP